jgi:pimeloyl-ACP methyl ester carboxylesterase
MPAKTTYLKLLEANNNDRRNPLFIYFSGMDGTGELLNIQADGLTKYFDVKCLAIPNHDLNDWDVLTNSVIDEIEVQLQDKEQKSIYLCGESFGGCLALSVAITAPSLVEKLILVNPATSFARSFWLNFGLLTQFLPESIHYIGTLFFLPFLAALDKIQRRDRMSLLRAMRSVPPKTVSWRISLLKKFAIAPQQLHQFIKPVLLIASASDRLLPSVEEANRLVDLFPNSETVILPNSGHACLLERDVNLTKILKQTNFLEIFDKVV